MYIKGYVHAVLNFYIEIYSPKFSGSRIIFHLLLKISDDVITLTKFFFVCVWVFGKGRDLEVTKCCDSILNKFIFKK